MKVTFITGNPNKARMLKDNLDYEVEHMKVELDEIQSLELKKIVEHKVRQAYQIVKGPVLVEDVSLRLDALGGLPGPLIKWFLEEMGAEGICNIANKLGNHEAVAEVCYGYFDGNILKLFVGQKKGIISPEVRGEDFGWNRCFIPEGSDKTYAEMSGEESERFALRSTTVYPELKKFLSGLDSK
jgi:non-canonical purine NTP pyrophosphatase (RdgB/HAM1 family)